MYQNLVHKIRSTFLIALPLFISANLFAQTDADGITMSKNNFCTGFMYNNGSWNNYWEGTFKRDNANLGKVSTQMFGIMGNYGLTEKLNVLFGLPYVKTKATGGQLHGMKGVQDLSLWLKYRALETNVGPGVLSLFTIAGISVPVSDYNADFLPLAIGLHSTNLSLRGMIDYQVGNIFATVAATYVARSNIKIYKSAYYTTEMHYTNEVAMPDATQFNVRTGYRSNRFIAEALLSTWTTRGGFDITKNNMPFPSNKMNSTTAGINLKYYVRQVAGLSFIGGTDFTLAGRNVGKTTSYNGGVFYIFDFTQKTKSASSKSKTK